MSHVILYCTAAQTNSRVHLGNYIRRDAYPLLSSLHCEPNNIFNRFCHIIPAAMRAFVIAAVVGNLAFHILARPTAHSDHVVHEKRDNIQRKWIQSNALDSDYIIPARIGLKQSNLQLGEQYLHEV